MIWLLIAFAAAVVIAYVLRKKPSAGLGIDLSDQKKRAQMLSDNEQEELAQEARQLALAGYDRLNAGAEAAGKSESFSHQAGVLDAIFCVLANDDRSRQSDDIRRTMQFESIPFNKLDPALGRAAVAEYLVWKFFPAKADKQQLGIAFRQFVDDVFEQDGSDDKFIYEMIYSGKWDWQKLAINAAQERVETPDA